MFYGLRRHLVLLAIKILWRKKVAFIVFLHVQFWIAIHKYDSLKREE